MSSKSPSTRRTFSSTHHHAHHGTASEFSKLPKSEVKGEVPLLSLPVIGGDPSEPEPKPEPEPDSAIPSSNFPALLSP
eukprot:CAMPEP_0171654770 /NCGR_PEP_ID=MMETSP0990-20121206/40436_1 /TAXON_ID=483369 /ORGANISM="non described non described, Strain CCMP2098" /LENGTH=77 /DNA_ID=CAMNT_0012234621 /DNA_START=148 /DNA_END=377 /DNA_ORIENTATION=-